MDETPPFEHDERPRRRWFKWAAIGVVAALVLLVGGVLLYTKVLNNAPEKLDESDLASRLVVTTTAPSTAAGSAGTDTTDDIGAPFDGDWVPTDASEFGYRVDEVIAGVSATAAGRSNMIDGLLTIDGTAATAVDIEVQVDTITSDDGLRDSRFRSSIMNTEKHPTASFHLTEPIQFGTIPVGDEQITATAVGELTLRGSTNPVTFDLTAQTTGGRIGVLGSIPVVFSDYGIDNPSYGGIKTEDDGLVEFVLVFDRA